jgi:hypothetical protein
MNELNKWNNGNSSLTPERRLMNEALARLGQVESAGPETRGAVKRAGRLIFILDLTGSREPGLKQARIATAAMFDAIKKIGSVSIKLIYFRGSECKAGRWENNPATVSKTMQKLSCKVGGTQIGRALRCVLEGEKEPVSGVVFIGDAFEDDENEVEGLAAAFGDKHTPIFVFHECCSDDDEHRRETKPFKRMAFCSGGVYSKFGTDSADELRELLSTVAAFSTAGAEGVKQMEPATTPQAQQLQARLLLLGPGDGDLDQKR